jgi:hypothetical protein
MTDKTTPKHHAEAILRAATPAAFKCEREGYPSETIFRTKARSFGDGWTKTPLYTAEAILSAVREAMEAERKAVVAYLLGPSRIDYEASGSQEHFSWWVADAIERGLHLPTPPRGEALSELIATTADQYGDTES